MKRFLPVATIWCLLLIFLPAVWAAKADTRQNKLAEHLCAIVEALRVVWGSNFDSNYRKYMLGSSPTVLLITREEMRVIAAARVDGRIRDGETTQGLTISSGSAPGERPSVRIVVVYDGLAPLLVAGTIIHEIGHLELAGQGLSRNAEEARIRKVVDTGFFEKVLGRQRLEKAVGELQKKVLPVEKGRRIYAGYTPEAVRLLYQRLKKAGGKVDQSPLHDKILANMVFILMNNEESLEAALDFEDAQTDGRLED